MKIILKHVLRNLKENKKRSIMIMLSLAIVGIFISFITSIVVMYFNLEDTIESELTGNYDYRIANKDGSEVTKKQLESLKYDFDSFAYQYTYGYMVLGDRENRAEISGINFDESYKFNIVSDEGNPIKLNDFEVVMLESAAEDYELKIGDTFTFINSKSEEYEMKLGKTLKNDTNLMYMKDMLYSFAVNTSTYKSIFGDEEKYYSYYLKSKKQLTSEEEKDFVQACEEIGLKTDINDEALSLDGTLDVIIAIVLLIILILCIIVYFINNSFIKIIVNERVPIMGTFRSVGANQHKVKTIMILEMIIYGLFAGLIGTFIGFGLCRALISFVFIPLMEELASGIDFSFLTKTIDNDIPLIFISNMTLIIIFQIFLSIKDIIKMSKISIKDSIFSKHDDTRKYDIVKISICFAGLIICILSLIFSYKLNIVFAIVAIIFMVVSITEVVIVFSKLLFSHIKFKNYSFKMACDNIVNSKILSSNTVIVTVLMVIMMALLSFADEYKYEAIGENDNYNYDVIIEAYNSSDSSELLYLDGVEDVITFDELLNNDDLYIANNKVNKKYLLLSTNNAIGLSKMDKSYENINDSIDKLKDNEIVIDSATAKKYGLKVNDYIYLTFKKVVKDVTYELEYPIYVKIVAIDDSDGSDETIFISQKLMDDLNSNLSAGSNKYIYIDAEDGYDIKKLVDNINAFYKENEFLDEAKSKEDYFQDQESESNGIYIGVIVACIFITIIVLICIVNNLKISFYQRKKDFATMYSICMSRKQLKTLIKNEIMISYLISALFAFVYSIIIVNLMEIMVGLPFRWTLLTEIIVIIVMFIVMLLIARKIGKQVDKLDIIDEIKYE